MVTCPMWWIISYKGCHNNVQGKKDNSPIRIGSYYPFFMASFPHTPYPLRTAAVSINGIFPSELFRRQVAAFSDL